MDVLLWITMGFITIGWIVLLSMKKSMERKLAFIKENPDSEESAKEARPIIGWIVSTTVWGIVSIILVVGSFHQHFG